MVSAKPQYVPKPGAQPQVVSAPDQTINAPFRVSRKILSKEVLPGGSITYNLGAFLPTANSVDNAVPDIIQVCATDIGDYVSYEELERFEHEDFELELATENEENEKRERRKAMDLLHGSFKRGRGRPKKHKGLLSPLGHRRRRVLDHIISDTGGDSSETESETSSNDREGTANNVFSISEDIFLTHGADKVISNHQITSASTKSDRRHNLQVRVEIPIRSNEKVQTISRSIFQGVKPKIEKSIVKNRFKLSGSTQRKSSEVNSIISSFTPISDSSRDEKKPIQSSEGFSSHEPKIIKNNPIASSISQQNIKLESFKPAVAKVDSIRDEEPQQNPAGRSHKTPVDDLAIASVNAPNFSAKKSTDPIIISDRESDDEGDEHHVRRIQTSEPQQSKSQRSTHQDNYHILSKAIPTLSTHELIKKDHFAFPTTKLNHRVAQPFPQHSIPSPHQSSNISNSAAASAFGGSGLLDQSFAPPTHPLSHSSINPKSSPVFVPDTDSEDDLAADEQLLRKFEGEKAKAIDSADSLLRRFQKPPSKNLHSSSSSLKPPSHKASNQASAGHKNPKIPSSTHRIPSMTSPFPSGKPVRHSIPPGTKEKPQPGPTKTLGPPGESENDSSTKKRKREKLVGRWRTGRRPSDDPDADWSPKG